MKTMFLKIISFVLALSLVFGFVLTSNVYAYDDKNYEYISDITSQNFLLYYDQFKVYHGSDFLQASSNADCGPTLVANVLSYYKRLGYDRLYSGDVTQSMFDEISDIIGYGSKGTHFGWVYKGVKHYAENAGYKFHHDVYLFDTWADMTRDIKLGYAVIASLDYENDDLDHGVFIVGFRIIDGVRQIYVCTGNYPEFEWLDFDSLNIQMESMYITES